MKMEKFASACVGLTAAGLIFGAGMKFAGAGNTQWVGMMFGHASWQVTAFIGVITASAATIMWRMSSRS